MRLLDYLEKIKEKNLPYPENYTRDRVYEISELDTYLPKGISVKDIDRASIESFKSICDMSFNGKKLKIVPFISPTSRIADRKRLWDATVDDKKEDINFPFVVLQRDPMVKKGTIYGSVTSNIPSVQTHLLNRVPILNGGKISYVDYKIPQYVPVDIVYSLHFFSDKLYQYNEFNERIYHAFQSPPYPIELYNHIIHLFHESSEDNSRINDVQERRFNHGVYKFISKTYLIDEEQFDKKQIVSKVNVEIKNDYERNESITPPCDESVIDITCDECLEFEMTRKDSNSITFRMKNAFEFLNVNLSYSNDYNFYINNEEVRIPFRVKKNDKLTFAHGINLRRKLVVRTCGKKI